MKSCTGEEHARAYRTLQEYLVKRGLRPKLQHLDNEASAHLTTFMDDEAEKYQLTPAGLH